MTSQEQTHVVEENKIVFDQVVKNMASNNRFQNLANDRSQYNWSIIAWTIYYGHLSVNKCHMTPLLALMEDSSILRSGIKNR